MLFEPVPLTGTSSSSWQDRGGEGEGDHLRSFGARS